MTDRERSWHVARLAREEREAAAAAAAAEQRDRASRPTFTAAKSVDRGGAPPRTPQHLPSGSPPMTRPSSGSVGSSSSHIAAAPAAWSNRTPDLKAQSAQARPRDSMAAEPALTMGGPPVGRGPSTLSSSPLDEAEEDDAFMLPPTSEPVRAQERSTSLTLPAFTPAAPTAATAAAPTAAPAAASSSTASPQAKPAIAWGDQAAANRSRASTLNASTKADASAGSAATSAAASSSSASAAAAPVAASSTAPPSPALAATTGMSPASSAASSRSAAFLEKVSTDLGQPTLVMHSCHLRLNAFAIAIHSGFLKSIYNFLLDLFSEDVKQYLEDTLNYGAKPFLHTTHCARVHCLCVFCFSLDSAGPRPVGLVTHSSLVVCVFCFRCVLQRWVCVPSTCSNKLMCWPLTTFRSYRESWSKPPRLRWRTRRAMQQQQLRQRLEEEALPGALWSLHLRLDPPPPLPLLGLEAPLRRRSLSPPLCCLPSNLPPMQRLPLRHWVDLPVPLCPVAPQAPQSVCLPRTNRRHRRDHRCCRRLRAPVDRRSTRQPHSRTLPPPLPLRPNRQPRPLLPLPHHRPPPSRMTIRPLHSHPSITCRPSPSTARIIILRQQLLTPPRLPRTTNEIRPHTRARPPSHKSSHPC